MTRFRGKDKGMDWEWISAAVEKVLFVIFGRVVFLVVFYEYDAIVICGETSVRSFVLACLNVRQRVLTSASVRVDQVGQRRVDHHIS